VDHHLAAAAAVPVLPDVAGSAFSWMTRLAEVCRMKIVHRPSRIPEPRRTPRTPPVISVRPRRVDTLSLSLRCFI